MFSQRFFMIFLLLFIISASISLAQTRLFVGVSPAVVDLGEVGRGTTQLVKFFVVTVSNEPLLVYLQPENGRLDFFDIKYNDLIFNYSEEDCIKWVRFLDNPVELKPQNETLKTNYESIKGWREVSFLLEIPKDAEPGYHLIKINPIPSSPSTSQGRVGAQIVAITSVNVLFKISGDAKREGIILDTVPGDYKPSELEINTYFQNTGTTTITATATQTIYDKDGNFIADISSAKEPVKPEELKIFKSSLPLTGLSLGNYEVFTKVFYTTDSANKNSTISITSEALDIKPEEKDFTIWLFIFIVLIIAFIVYRWVH